MSTSVPFTNAQLNQLVKDALLVTKVLQVGVEAAHLLEGATPNEEGRLSMGTGVTLMQKLCCGCTTELHEDDYTRLGSAHSAFDLVAQFLPTARTVVVLCDFLISVEFVEQMRNIYERIHPQVQASWESARQATQALYSKSDPDAYTKFRAFLSRKQKGE